MKRLCRVGDVIKCDRLGPLFVNRSKGHIELDQLEKDRASCGNPWLVVATNLQGGGTGYGPHDIYPDGHHVTVMMLTGFKENLRVYAGDDAPLSIGFYQTGCFTTMIPMEEIELVTEVEIVPTGVAKTTKQKVVFDL